MSSSTSSSLNTQTLKAVLTRFGGLLVSAWMLLIFLLANFVIPGLVPPDLNLYLVQPLLWSSLAGLVLILRLADSRTEPAWVRKDLLFSGPMLAGIQVAAALLLGLLLGFGSSPYSREAGRMALNVWFIAARLLGVETARWYLGSCAARKHPRIGFLLAWLAPLVVMIPAGKYSLPSGPEQALLLTGQTLLPAAAESALAASLAAAGGPLAALGYRGLLQVFEWISPILPNLPWMAAAFVGVLVPVLGLIAIHQPEPVPAPLEPARKPAGERASPVSWLLVLVLAVGVIWFNSGALGVRPSLVSGNSMNPTLYPGDLVITQRSSPDKISPGEIIRFHRDGIDIVHRVVAVRSENGQVMFTTRGDNNLVDDDPVAASLVQGKVVLTLPKIGWVSIYLRQALGWIGGRR